MTDRFHSKVAAALEKDQRRNERVLVAARKHTENVRSAIAWAFTAPRNLRHIDGPAHRKRFNKLLAQLIAADEEKTA